MLGTLKLCVSYLSVQWMQFGIHKVIVGAIKLLTHNESASQECTRHNIMQYRVHKKNKSAPGQCTHDRSSVQECILPKKGGNALYIARGAAHRIRVQYATAPDIK